MGDTSISTSRPSPTLTPLTKETATSVSTSTSPIETSTSTLASRSSPQLRDPITDKRCHPSGRVGAWGDLGTKITKEECLARCLRMDTCRFVSYRSSGNQQCTSFKSCKKLLSVDSHTTWEKAGASDPAHTTPTTTVASKVET